MSRVKIIGQVKSSFIDYPGKMSTTIFLAGCNMRCGYCHNPDIVKGYGSILEEEDFFDFLDKRRKFLNGVCVSGGESTLHPKLPEFLKDIKLKGYGVKLDTNGTNPDMLEKLVEDELIDYVAMDIKGPLYKYNEIAGTDIDIQKILKSISILKNSSLNHEFRTTIAKEILNIEDIIAVAKILDYPKRYALQNFKRAKNILENNKVYTSYTLKELNEMKESIQGLVGELIMR